MEEETERLHMSCYLIDFENVRTDGVRSLTDLKNGDKVAIFYSEQCKNITLDVIESLTKLGVQIECYKAKLGTKNALDFQLSSYLGYIIGKGKTDEDYCIVSNDKGYDCLCDFWKEQGESVKRIPLVDANKEAINTSTAQTIVPKKKKSKVQAGDLATIEEIKKYLSKADCPEDVLAIFNQYKTKQAICNGMSKKFKDSKRASAIYKKLKPLLKEKNKS